MKKSHSLPQNIRITQGRTGAETADRTDFQSGLRRQMAADNAHYHAEKLGLGDHDAHEGWIKAEQVEAASHIAVSTEARHHMIAVAAFYLAETRGFAEHGADQDWIKAEAKIDVMLHGRL
jgi:hypothetical protein